jgi:hypothetical protein
MLNGVVVILESGKEAGVEKAEEMGAVISALLFDGGVFVRLMKGETSWFRAALRGRPVNVIMIAVMQIRKDKIHFMCLMSKLLISLFQEPCMVVANVLEYSSGQRLEHIPTVPDQKQSL